MTRYDHDAMKRAIRQELRLHPLAEPISMTNLHVAVTGDLVIPGRRHNMARATRKIIAELRAEGCPIGFTSDGYFWAATPEELTGTIDRFHSSALHSLRIVKALRQISSTALAHQVRLDLDADEQGVTP